MMPTSGLVDSLARTRNADGGWGYYAGKASRLEATCWAMLAVSTAGDAAGRDRLRTWPTRDGLLLERPGGSVNVAFHALALCVLSVLGLEHVDSNGGLVAALQRARGVRLKNADTQRQDNSLQGWPWIAETFSWVEPTAWSLLALTIWSRQSGTAADPVRLEDGARLLFDRVCREGGWNYGNANMLGTDLHPHVPTSALGLLSLQAHRDAEPVRRTLGWLEHHALSERSGMTLALTALALEAYGRPIDDVRAAIAEQLPVTATLGNQCSVAAALYALREPTAPSVFTLESRS